MTDLGEKRFLVAGCGSIGRRHLSNLEALGIRDFVLLERDEARLAEAAEGLQQRPILAVDLGRALEARPYAAIICLPTSLHLPCAMRLAREGVHLFIEKPLSHTMAGVAELAELVSVNGITAMMAMCYRFHPVIRAIKERLSSGIIGRVYHVNYFGGFYLPYWQRGVDYRKGYAAREELGGGVLLTSIHGLDNLRWLFGEAAEVKAFTSRVSSLEIDVEDLALAVMRLASGAYVSWQTDFLQQADQHRMVIVGEKGTMRFDIIRGVEEICIGDGGKWQSREIPFEVSSMYVQEMECFLSALATGAPVMAGLGEGVKTLELAMEVRESALGDSVKEEMKLCLSI
ncbi:MAG: Gfo/Idh/MocA family protein [Thermodesulfobacteriota bacterium]